MESLIHEAFHLALYQFILQSGAIAFAKSVINIEGILEIKISPPLMLHKQKITQPFCTTCSISE